MISERLGLPMKMYSFCSFNLLNSYSSVYVSVNGA